jgi:hypothetical protein
MYSVQPTIPIKNFNLCGINEPVVYSETIHVADGVDCDVYTFVNDSSKDLGIIRIESGKSTPLQKVLKGKKTIEGHISGKGKLTITKSNGKRNIYVVDENNNNIFEVIVKNWRYNAMGSGSAFKSYCI